MQKLAFVVITVACLFAATLAQAVTSAKNPKAHDAFTTVTTSAASRAEADLEIRRLRGAIATRNIDDDRTFDKLERLQLQLRGQN